jgi:hypothetical protein
MLEDERLFEGTGCDDQRSRANAQEAVVRTFGAPAELLRCEHHPLAKDTGREGVV